MNQKWPKKIENAVVDSRYESEENFRYSSKNKQNDYIKP